MSCPRLLRSWEFLWLLTLLDSCRCSVSVGNVSMHLEELHGDVQLHLLGGVLAGVARGTRELNGGHPVRCLITWFDLKKSQYDFRV